MMDTQELRQHLTELLINRMNGIYEADMLVYQAEKLREYIQNGTVPPPNPPPPTSSLGGSATCSQQPQTPKANPVVRDYYKRP